MNSICLNMIVKNESGIIEKCLASVKGIVNYWVIVDTGSNDGTQKIIRDFMRDIPGELHERPWVDFAHNRNEALHLAKGKGDYLLFIDADERLEFSSSFRWPELNKAMYLAPVILPEGVSYYRQLLIDNRLADWSWKGIIHEEICRKGENCTEVLQGVVNRSTPSEGNRGKDARKYWKDAQILEDAVKKEPENVRYAFFLAQSYQVAQEYRLAIPCWERRAAMGGSEEEVFYALYAIGRLQLVLEMPPEQFMSSLERAYRFRPSRAEPLFWMARHEFSMNRFHEAYRLTKQGISHPLPSDNVYVEHWIYDYGMLSLFADCAFELKKFQEMKEAAQNLLSNPRISADSLAMIHKKLLYVEFLMASKGK